MDVLLGEDESLPGKRLALICSNCRLVNGQAPPGVKRVEDVGKWRCAGCETMNGEDNDVKKIVAQIKHEANATDAANSSAEPSAEVEEKREESDITQYSSEEEEDEDEEVGKEDKEEDGKADTDIPKTPAIKTESPRRSTRARKKKSVSAG